MKHHIVVIKKISGKKMFYSNSSKKRINHYHINNCKRGFRDRKSID